MPFYGSIPFGRRKGVSEEFSRKSGKTITKKDYSLCKGIFAFFLFVFFSSLSPTNTELEFEIELLVLTSCFRARIPIFPCRTGFLSRRTDDYALRVRSVVSFRWAGMCPY